MLCWFEVMEIIYVSDSGYTILKHGEFGVFVLLVSFFSNLVDECVRRTGLF